MATITVDKNTLTDFLGESGTYSFEVEEFNYSRYSAHSAANVDVSGSVNVDSDFVFETDDFVAIDEYCAVADELEAAERRIKELEVELEDAETHRAERAQTLFELMEEHEEFGKIIENQRLLLEGVHVTPAGGFLSQTFAAMGL
jgi:hypothetical protein